MVTQTFLPESPKWLRPVSGSTRTQGREGGAAAPGCPGQSDPDPHPRPSLTSPQRLRLPLSLFHCPVAPHRSLGLRAGRDGSPQLHGRSGRLRAPQLSACRRDCCPTAAKALRSSALLCAEPGAAAGCWGQGRCAGSVRSWGGGRPRHSTSPSRCGGRARCAPHTRPGRRALRGGSVPSIPLGWAS